MLHKVIGPKGGIHKADVSCYTCVCGTSCNMTRMKWLGCGEWVSVDGQRVFWGADKDIDLPARPAGNTCDGCDKCGDACDPPPLPPYRDDEMASSRPFQQEFNKLQEARIEHIREELEAERIAPQDEDPHD